MTAVIYSNQPRSVPGWPCLKRARFESRRGVPGSASLALGLLPRLPSSLAGNGGQSRILTSQHPFAPPWPGMGVRATSPHRFTLPWPGAGLGPSLAAAAAALCRRSSEGRLPQLLAVFPNPAKKNVFLLFGPYLEIKSRIKNAEVVSCMLCKAKLR